MEPWILVLQTLWTKAGASLLDAGEQKREFAQVNIKNSRYILPENSRYMALYSYRFTVIRYKRIKTAARSGEGGKEE